MKGVLSDMNSFDYAIKNVVDFQPGGFGAGERGAESSDSFISKPRLKQLLKDGRAGGAVDDGEVRERGGPVGGRFSSSSSSLGGEGTP